MTQQGVILARKVIKLFEELRDGFYAIFVLSAVLAGGFTISAWIWDARWCIALSLILDGVAISFGYLYYQLRKGLK